MSTVHEVVLSTILPKYAVSHPIGGCWRLYQQQFLTPHSTEFALDQVRLWLVEQRTGLTCATLKALRHGEYACPAHTAFSIANVQQDFPFLRLLAETTRAQIRPLQTTMAAPIGNYLLHLTKRYSHFFDMTDLLEGGAVLTDGQQTELEQMAEAIKAQMDAIVEQSRARRLQEERV
jgi:hypothetical protein